MCPKKNTNGFRPFAGLAGKVNLDPPLVEPPRVKTETKSKQFSDLFTEQKPTSTPSEDESLFRRAMGDVAPLAQKKRSRGKGKNKKKDPAETERREHAETVESLQKLIDEGEGFYIAHTPEYMEGTGYKVHREMARRLHRGDFAIQDFIDLHGLTVAEAKPAFDEFLRESICQGKRAVLVIHGRGLSSPDKPILKTKIMEWLSAGAWRKWVLAFTSARKEDGGPGATYVLLRTHPAGKRLRRGERIRCRESLP